MLLSLSVACYWRLANPARQSTNRRGSKIQWEENMVNIAAVAKDFFEACEAGKGWEGCRAYCLPNATFSAPAEPLAEIRTLQAYTE